MRLRVVMLLAALLALCCSTAASAAPAKNKPAKSHKQDRLAAPNPLPSMDALTKPNASPTQPLSFDSGLDDIPACEGASVALQPIWGKAAQTFGMRWQILAAITKVESGFGCNQGPSSAGAVGWTQFMPSTWDRWGTDADGDGVADPHNAVDAVFSTARYLRVGGAPQDYRAAIFSYNHADWYVDMVLEAAQEFGAFDLKQATEIAKLSSAGSKLQRQVTDMRAQLDKLRDQLQERRDDYEEAGRLLDESKQLLQQRTQELQDAQDRLNDLTLQYIETTVSLSDGQGRPLTDDQQLLAYAGESDPQDAVLVYASARSILDDQGRRMDKLRDASARAGQLQSDVAALVAGREQALADRAGARADAARLVQEQEDALAEADKQLRQLRRLQARYAAEYEQITGQTGTLAASPFAEGQYANLQWEGDFRWPVTAPLTSRMGARWGSQHEGVDLGVSQGTPVHAAAGGVVSFAGEQGGYGNLVIVQHGDGYSTRYGHLSRIDAKQGDKVKQGDVVALSGSTGRSTGPHLHFEVRLNDQPVDPLTMLPKTR